MKKIESRTFKNWLTNLRDTAGRARIISRINRLTEGLSGDVAPVGAGISELRIHHGPGYRVYFHQAGNQWLILLCAGDKSSQSRDIKAAEQILKAWRVLND